MDSVSAQPDRCTRIVVRFTDDSTFCEISPFRTAAEIRAVIGDVRSAKATGEGALLITTPDYDPVDQTYRILQLDRLLGKSIAAKPAIRQETRAARGIYVYAFVVVPSLTDVSDEEIVVEHRDQGVSGRRPPALTYGYGAGYGYEEVLRYRVIILE